MAGDNERQVALARLRILAVTRIAPVWLTPLLSALFRIGGGPSPVSLITKQLYQRRILERQSDSLPDAPKGARIPRDQIHHIISAKTTAGICFVPDQNFWSRRLVD